MPSEPWFWIAIAAVVALVLIFAIWNGNIGLDVTKKSLRFSTSDRQDQDVAAARSSKVSVADDAETDGRVGRITGETLREGDLRAGETSVSNKAKISGSVDEITGRSVSSSPKR